MKNWKVYIVTHKNIKPEYYSIDKDFNNDNWGIINVSNNKLSDVSLYDNYDIIDMINLPKYTNLGPWYAEMEAIYNIFINKIYDKYDYIGFIHHDYQLKSLKDETDITNQINNAINIYDIIYFSKCTYDYNQRILADINQPNTLQGYGFNCYDYIINDYNMFYKKNENIDDWKSNIPKNICSASLYTKEIFEEMMRFFSPIIETGKLNIFDTEHRYRIQGGLFERYISVFLDKLNKPYYDLELNHLYKENK